MRGSALLLLMLGACASSSGPAGRSAASLPSAHPPREREPPVDLDAPGPLAEAWRRPHVVLDGRTGVELDDPELDARLGAARVIYAAEKHDDPSNHQVQLALLDRARRLGSVGVGFEMVQRPYQPALDAYAETGDEAALLEGTEWEKRWGYDFRLYRPLFRYARQHRIPLLALNARKELTRAVARGGLDALPPEMKADLPELLLDETAHRSRIRLVWKSHVAPHGGMPFEAFYAAQVTWDETMADTVARAAQAERSPARWVVLAGSGHIRYGEGIPSRVERRGVGPGLSVLPVELDEATLLIGSGAADVLWVFTGPVDS